MTKSVLAGSVFFYLAGLNIANATVIFSDNFDTNAGQSSVSSGLIDASTTGSFTVTAGNIDVVGPNYFPNLCVTPESGSCVDLDGSAPGQITSTSIALAAGNYTLAFEINGSQRGGNASATVSFGSVFNQIYNTASGDTYAVLSNFTVNSPTSAQLVFTSSDPGGSQQGALVDNVIVTYTGALSTVPEPGSFLLLLAGISGAWSIRKLVR
jgi:hypothetical protein